jgi:hypothetical protein
LPMNWFDWLRGLFRKPPGRVTNVRAQVIPMKEIAVSWDLPVIRDDGSPMPLSEIAYTEASLSTDKGTTFTALGQVKPDTIQIVKRSPIADGSYLFRFVVVGINGKKGKPTDLTVPVDTPAPGVVVALKATVT